MKITVTGASDDLIEIGGDISEEFDGGRGRALLVISDGTILNILYDDDGIWRVSRIREGAASFTHTPGDVDKDTFDVATIEGEFSWIARAEEVATPKKTTRIEK